jgi:hypothetical protein
MKQGITGQMSHETTDDTSKTSVLRKGITAKCHNYEFSDFM